MTSARIPATQRKAAGGESKAMKVDYSKSMRDLYSASGITREVIVDAGTFLGIDGQGEPDGPAFQKAIEDLYGVVYAIKALLKKDEGIDYTVSKLEALWFLPESADTPPSEWRWRLMMRVPNNVEEEHLHSACEAVRKKKKGEELTDIELYEWNEGRAMQLLHIGPYNTLSDTYGRLMARIKEKGLRPDGPGHEIYLSDPRRASEENLKTIVRMPVAPTRG